MCSVTDGVLCDLSHSYGKSDFSEEDWIALKARTGVKLKAICENHKKNYYTFFEAHERQCCDPFTERRHQSSRPVKSFLKTITVPMFLKSRGALEFRSRLVPGQKLCRTCFADANKVLRLVQGFSEPPSSASSATCSQDLGTDSAAKTIDIDQISDRIQTSNSEPGSAAGSQDLFADEEGATCSAVVIDESEGLYTTTHGRVVARKSYNLDESEELSQDTLTSSGGSDYNPERAVEALSSVNNSLQAIGVSPVIKRKLDHPTYASSKIKKVEDKLKDLISTSSKSSALPTEPHFESTIVKALQQKVSSGGTSEKILALSVALTAYSQRKVVDLFGEYGATDWLIRKTYRLMEEQDGLFPISAPKKGHSISQETQQLVVSFYENDESSRQLPGKKDYVSLRINGEKVQIQKRLILCNLKELYAMFKVEHPYVALSFSKFAAIRPRHCVFAGAAGTHSICVCKYHQNFKLMVDGAKFSNMDVNIVSYKDCMQYVTCSSTQTECYLHPFCPQCPGLEPLRERLLDIFSENLVDEVIYQQWTATDRSSLETKVQAVPEFVDLFVNSLSSLLPHHFIAKAQSKYLAKLKEDLDESTVIVVCDFSENYSFVLQDSVQGFYWSNEQATIFPFACYCKVDGTVQPLSLIVVSDYMKHSTFAFYTFQKKLIAFLKQRVPVIKKIIYFSDGAASQFKSCYMLEILSHHEEDFGLICEWHYFATSHGKGPSDGLGGSFKRSAARASLQGQLIRSPQELFSWASDQNSAATTVFVSKEEVSECLAFLKSRVYQVLSVPGIRDYHSAIPISTGEMFCKRYSESNKSIFTPVEIVRKHPSLAEVKASDFVAVRFRKSWTIGQTEVNEEGNQNLLIKLLDKKGNNRFSLSTKPIQSILLSDVIMTVELHSSEDRMLYELPSDELTRIVWQWKILSGKKMAQPEQIRKGTWS